jgi:hypothetical protein
MKRKFLKPAIIAFAVMIAAPDAFGQKKKITKELFAPTVATKVTFVPYKISDFTTDAKKANQLITLPNKKKVKLSDYVNALNTLESNLSAMGFPKNRAQKTIVASRFKKADFTRPATTTVLPAAAARPANVAINQKFVTAKLSDKLVVKGQVAEAFAKLKQAEVNALPNEKIDRVHHLTPAPFRNGDYSAKLDVTCYLKGELDPFFVNNNQVRFDSITRLMKETTSFFTAGMNITVSADIPEIGNISAYKLETEYTARSNKSRKHSSKSKLTVMQHVIINESNANRSGDVSTYKENKLYNISRLIGAADVFTYGLNIIMPVDFYLSASSIGANIDVDMTRTGISGSIGPRVAQSIFLETSLTETVGPFGEGLSNVADAGVGGELRLMEGGFDYGFSAGIGINGGRIISINDMEGQLDLEFLRGRLFTFYEYPVFTCGQNLFKLADVECWEMRRVENELFNTGAALKFEKTIINEDRSALVKW